MYIKKKGFSLVELLVALAVNVIAITALVKIFSSNVTNYNNVVSADTLYQQMETAMQLMTNDIRRAGFWGSAASMVSTNANSNPFQQSATDVTISGGNCILFSYDYSRNGTIASISAANDDERYGYRLINQILQARPQGASYACNAAANTWDNVTNSNLIQITALSFTMGTVVVPVGATANYLQLRTVTISITGRLAANTAVTATMTQTVRIRNDKFVA